MDIFKTVVQLASQEPAGSRLLQEAEAALQKAQTLQQEVIEWANKPAAPLPCVMEIREHSECVSAVAVSPDGKWIASASANEIRLWPMPDLSTPPFHTLPYEQLMAKLRALTNLQVVADATATTGYRVEVGRFPGWKDVPAW